MRGKRTTILVLAGIAFVVSVWIYATSSYASRANGTQRVEWQYGQLTYGPGKPPVFASSVRRNAFGDRTTTEQRLPQKHGVAALDILGIGGWEAVSMASTKEGIVVLLKRHAVRR